jgi:Ca-activated chloride channel family protein
MMPPEFHFLRPGWLVLLPLVPIAVYLFLRARRDRRRWEAVCDPALLPHVLIDRGPGTRRRWPGVALGLVGVLGITALAGPAWERLPQPVFRAQSALVVALDLSRSMAAADLTPSRLARATYALRDILEARPDGQTGLVVFAADAFVVSPLTDDIVTIEAQLPALEPGIMPAQGSRPERAVALASGLLEQAGAGRGDILLLTDGAADPDAVEAAARAAAAAGYAVSVLAVGTAAGAPIPAPEGGFVTDAGGGIVVPRLDEDALRGVARAGGGSYVSLEDGPQVLATLGARWQPGREAGEETGLVTDSWLDRGPWLAALIVPFAVLGFRRGVLTLAACALLPLAPEARAAEWDGLWLRPDQQGAAAMAEGDPERAQRLFEDRRWRAAAAYRAGDYAAAAEALEGLEDADSLYNRGNALARAGRLGDALASYEQALALAPEHEDARHNRDLLRELGQPGQSGGEGEQGDSDARPRDAAGGDGAGERPPQQAATGSPEEGEASDERSGGQPDTGSSEGEGSASGQAGSRGDPDSLSAAERQALANQAGGNPGQRLDMPEGPESADGARQVPETTRSTAGGGDEDASADEAEPGSLTAAAEPDESEQATEQWLRRIPDDPGGLLRRKFYYQYRERGAAPGETEEEQSW